MYCSGGFRLCRCWDFSRPGVGLLQVWSTLARFVYRLIGLAIEVVWVVAALTEIKYLWLHACMCVPHFMLQCVYVCMCVKSK